MKKIYKISFLISLSVLFAACGGGGGSSSGGETGTAGVTALKTGDMNGSFTCVGGSYSLDFIISGACTDNQLIQGTCTRTVTISGDNYYGYAGATASVLLLNMGVIQGPDTKPYYYGKTFWGDKLVYERYVPVLRAGAKIGVAVKSGSIYDTSGTEYSLDGNKNLLVTSYAPKPLPANLTYSKESGGPGQIEATTQTCNRAK
jgi:hypothetical protein